MELTTVSRLKILQEKNKLTKEKIKRRDEERTLAIMYKAHAIEEAVE